MRSLSPKRVLLGLVYCCAVMPIFAHELSEPTARAQLEIPELELEESLLYLGDRQHVHLGRVIQKSRPGGGRYTCTPLSSEKVAVAVSALKRSIAKISVKAPLLDLEFLILCDKVTANDQNIGGIPVPPLKLLMLSLEDADDSSIVHLFWHEVFHFLEIKAGLYQDSAWNQQFNGYLEEYQFSRPGLTLLGGGQKGFLNRYAMSFAYEERAEFAAWLLTQPNEIYAFVLEQNSVVLRQKFEFMLFRMQHIGLQSPGLRRIVLE